MYAAFLVFHRWLALITGLFLFVVALTGAVVVFEGPISRTTAMHVVPGPRPMSLDSLAARASAAAGGGDVGAVIMGESGDLAYSFAVGDFPRFKPVAIDPYTGVVIPPVRTPTRLQSTVRTFHRWHTGLTGGKTGKILVTVATVAGLILALTGLILWWRERLWRVRLAASWKRINFDVHHVFGLFAAVAILIMTLTGIWMLEGDAITPLVRKLDRTPQAPPPKAAPHEANAVSVSLDSIARLARAAIPGAALMNIQFQPTGLARVQMKYPEDHTPAGRSYAFIDRYQGTLLRTASTRAAEPGTRLINLQRSLHTGDVLGAPTQIIWFLSALMLASQAFTGVLMWWNGRPARKAASLRKAA